MNKILEAFFMRCPKCGQVYIGKDKPRQGQGQSEENVCPFCDHPVLGSEAEIVKP